jgi:hypothetical protein
MVAALVLAGLVLSAGVNRDLGGWGPALLAVLSVWRLVVNGPVEGVVLVQVSEGHGITGADLAGVAGLAVAVLRGAVMLRQRVRQMT